MMRLRFATFLFAALLVGAPALASAQTYTVLPVERDARVPSSERMAAFTAVSSARVLGPSSEFVAVGELEPRMASEFRSLTACTEVDCAARLADAAGLDAVLVIAVWPGENGRATTVGVTIVSPAGEIHEADAQVGEEGVAQAATQALVSAVRQQSRGDGVELRVASRPEGALVLVDGTEVGVTPYSGAFQRGAHSVEVRLRGMTQRREVDLEEHPVELDVDLESGTTHVGAGNGDDGGGGGTTPSRAESSMLNWILGGAAVALGATLLVPPIVTLAENGNVRVEPMGDTPGERAAFGAVSTVLLIAGAACAIAGGVVLVLQPIPGNDNNPSGAALRVSGTF